jgi:ABC-type uncharacterized transport system ATPase subunit
MNGMSLIRVENLKKEFKRQKRKHGFLEGVKGLLYREYENMTAVDDLSFEIGKAKLSDTLDQTVPANPPLLKCLSGFWFLPAGLLT